MQLFLLENDKTVDVILNSDKYSPGSDVIVCFNYLVYSRLKQEKNRHTFIFIEDLFVPDDYEKLHTISDRFASNWHFSNGIDFTFLDGISYGVQTRLIFSRKYMLTVLLKYGEIIQKACNKYPQVDKIYYDFSNQHNSFFLYKDDGGRFFNKQRLVEDVCRQLGVSVSLLVPKVFVPSQCTAEKFFQEKHKIKSLIRIFLEVFLNQINRAVSKKKDLVYFYNYFNIDNLLNYDTVQFVLDRLNWKMSLNIKKALRFLYLDFDNIYYRLKKKEGRFINALTEKFNNPSFLAEIDTDFVFNNISYRNIYLPAIKDLVFRVIPGLVCYAGRVRKGIRKYGIRKMVVNEELEEKIKIVIEVCKQEGVKTIWVDHGIQGQHHAQAVFERSLSGVVICAGEFYIDYYRKNSEATREFLSLGNPSMDPYSKYGPKKISEIKKVLFLSFEDNFYCRLDRFAYQEKYYVEMFSIFGELSALGIEIYFKPHPCFDKCYFDYLFDFCKVDAGKIHYLGGQSFTKIIRDMDLVVSNITNCFYEAQAAGIPTVFFEPNYSPKCMLPPFNAANQKEVIRLETGKQLFEFIKTNQLNPSCLNEFLDNFLKRYSFCYMNKLDGLASKRIVEYLAK